MFKISDYLLPLPPPWLADKCTILLGLPLVNCNPLNWYSTKRFMLSSKEILKKDEYNEKCDVYGFAIILWVRSVFPRSTFVIELNAYHTGDARFGTSL